MFQSFYKFIVLLIVIILIVISVCFIPILASSNSNYIDFNIIYDSSFSFTTNGQFSWPTPRI